MGASDIIIFKAILQVTDITVIKVMVDITVLRVSKASIGTSVLDMSLMCLQCGSCVTKTDTYSPFLHSRGL